MIGRTIDKQKNRTIDSILDRMIEPHKTIDRTAETWMDEPQMYRTIDRMLEQQNFFTCINLVINEEVGITAHTHTQAIKSVTAAAASAPPLPAVMLLTLRLFIGLLCLQAHKLDQFEMNAN